MAQKSKQGSIRFDGRFNSEIRKLIQLKRLQFGLPYQRIAKLFAANWSTVRKWETGPTETCSVAMRPKVENFLNGKYDEMLLAQQNDFLAGNYPQRLPECALRCIEKFNQAYHLLRFRPKLRDNMLANVDKITRESLKMMIAAEDQNNDT